MKTRFIKPLILLVAIIGINSFISAQRIHPKPKAHTQTIEKVIPITGTVSEWVYNDDFVYDGFYLQTNSENLFVKFPKHMGKELRAAIGKNTITVNGVINYSPMGEKEIKFTSIISNGKTIYDIPKERPALPPSETFISGKGKVVQFQQNDRGDTIGIILDTKTILRIPPHNATQLISLLVTGDNITFTGMERPKNNDEAYADSYSIVKCNTITINGEQYLIK